LEHGKFQWPVEENRTSIKISHRQLRWLLDGLQLEQRQAHPAVKAG